MRKLHAWWLVLMLISALLFSGCSNKKATNSSEREELEEISIMLDWYPNAVHSAIYAAKEKGYFAEEGISVKIEMPADTNDPLKLAAAGKVDLAISYQTQLLVSKAEGIPVVSIASLVNHTLDGIMVKAESGIQSPKDLEGKKVGFASASVSEAVVSTMVETAGGDPGKVKFIDVGWDLMPSLATDHVDAIIGAYVNHELVLLEKEGYEINLFKLTDFGVPDNYELIVVTGEKTLALKEDSFKRFWSALSKGQEYVKNNPDEGLKTLLNFENDSFPLDPEVEKESLQVLLPLMDSGAQPFGFQEDAVWELVAQWLYETNVIKEKLNSHESFKNIVEK